MVSLQHRRNSNSSLAVMILIGALVAYAYFKSQLITEINSTETSQIDGSTIKVKYPDPSSPDNTSIHGGDGPAPPQVLPTDLIYKNARTVFVIPEYKLIFFTFPKVACSEWKRMFMRINGNPNWCKIRGFDAHDPNNNKISILSEYPPEIATAMMTSPAWTRAAFVREPKERVLSAFLDKAVKEDYYVKKCCNRINNQEDQKTCTQNRKDFKSFIHFVSKYKQLCFDVHWEPQIVKVDEKWWPYIDFIGYQDNLLHDSQQLLESLTSERDTVSGRSAWERYGTSGWGNDNELCEKRPNSFLKENSSAHNLDTGSHMKEWYTAETEKMVEENWAVEWKQDKVRFSRVRLFPDNN